MTDYRALDKAGMWTSGMEEVRKLNVSDAEVTQLVALKNAGLDDEMCIALVAAAHGHQHPFASAESAKRLNSAGYTDEQILAIAKNDKLDTLSGDAVMLREALVNLVDNALTYVGAGLTDSNVQMLLQRRMKGLPTLSSAEIARLKNTQLSEKEIMARIENGMTDAEADAEASARAKAQAHSGTGFVRTRGRRR